MEIVMQGTAGSHLFGTNTPNSDLDFKGIYLPSGRDIVFQKIKETIDFKTNESGTKNTSEDIDSTYFSLDKFFKMLEKGETVALELLFTPKHCLNETSPLWNKIQNKREHFLHRGTLAFIGYARTQANKYGIKGSRMGAIKKVLSGISLTPSSKKISQVSELLDSFVDNELVQWSDILTNTGYVRYYEVCGRKFQHDISIGNMIDALVKIYDNYGERAKQAESNEGIDWKAVSHAFRVCFQGQELFRDHYITLPLKEKERDLVLSIKRGELPFAEVSEMLDKEIQNLNEFSSKSTLPDTLRKDIVDEILFDAYSKQVIKEVY